VTDTTLSPTLSGLPQWRQQRYFPYEEGTTERPITPRKIAKESEAARLSNLWDM